MWNRNQIMLHLWTPLLHLLLTVFLVKAQEGPQYQCKENGVCYWISTERTDATAAAQLCTGMKGILACPSSREKINDIYSVLGLQDETFWIGLYTVSYNNWRWIDGSPYEKQTTDWAPGHPKENRTFAYLKRQRIISTSEIVQDFFVLCQRIEYRSNAKLEVTSSSMPTRLTAMYSTTPSTTRSCGDSSWHMSRSGTCYYLAYTLSSTWRWCKDRCEAMDAHLATPSSPEKHRDLIDYIRWRQPNLYYENGFIGLYYPIEEGVPLATEADQRQNWVWVDGSIYNYHDAQWMDGEPGDREKWVRVRGGRLYATYDQLDAKFFVCQKEGKSPSSTSTQLTELLTTKISQTAPSSTITPDKTEQTLLEQLPKTMVGSHNTADENQTLGSFESNTEQPNGRRRDHRLLALIVLAVPIAMIIVVIVLIKKRILLITFQKRKGVQNASELDDLPSYGDHEYIDPSQVKDEYETLYHTIIGSEEYGNMVLKGLPGKNSGNTSISAVSFSSNYPEIIRKNSEGHSWLDLEFQMINDSLFKYRKQEVECSGSAFVFKPVFNLDWKVYFITTKTPQLESTMKEFWQAVRKFKSPIIINFSSPTNAIASDSYCPEEKGDIFYLSPLEIKCNSTEENKCVSQKKLALSFHDSENQPILHLGVRTNLSAKSPKELQEIFLSLYQDIQKINLKLNQVSPVLLHCPDGAQWTGLFCAYCFVLDQIQSQNQIDIFQVVSHVRFCCNQFVATKEQYDFLYELIFNFMI